MHIDKDIILILLTNVFEETTLGSHETRETNSTLPMRIPPHYLITPPLASISQMRLCQERLEFACAHSIIPTLFWFWLFFHLHNLILPGL